MKCFVHSSSPDLREVDIQRMSTSKLRRLLVELDEHHPLRRQIEIELEYRELYASIM